MYEELLLKKDKVKYVRNFGLAPHLKKKLLHDVRQTQRFSISYDESLNKETQECQLDLYIRFWDASEKKSCVRYWTTKFLGHATT